MIIINAAKEDWFDENKAQKWTQANEILYRTNKSRRFFLVVYNIKTHIIVKITEKTHLEACKWLTDHGYDIPEDLKSLFCEDTQV